MASHQQQQTNFGTLHGHSAGILARLHRGALGLSALALSLALAGCASKPPPARASKPAAKSSPSASSSADSEPRASAKETWEPAKASPSTKKKPPPKKSASAKAEPPPRAEKQPPVTAAERNFRRPAAGEVIAKFDGRGNKGLDFGGAQGDPVYASREGKVVYSAGGLRGYGQLIMIKHDARYVTAYAHNSQLLVKEGQSVKRGQVIARMGSTDTNRVKLHFELRRNGTAVDPAPYFASGEGADGH